MILNKIFKGGNEAKIIDRAYEQWELVFRDPQSENSSESLELVELHKKYKYDTITWIWTNDSNIYKFINKAIFLDWLFLYEKCTDEKFKDVLFPDEKEDFYQQIIRRSLKYMIMLNWFIKEKWKYTNEEQDKDISLYRGIDHTAFNWAKKGEKYRFLSYQSCSETSEIPISKFLK